LPEIQRNKAFTSLLKKRGNIIMIRRRHLWGISYYLKNAGKNVIGSVCLYDNRSLEEFSEGRMSRAIEDKTRHISFANYLQGRGRRSRGEPMQHIVEN